MGARRGAEPSDWAVWFAEPFKSVYKSLVLWSRTAKDPVNREETDRTPRMITIIHNNPRVHHQIFILDEKPGIWTGGRWHVSPPPCSVGFTVIWDLIVNGGDVYIFDNNTVRISETPALISKPQENQVARSQIKHADEQPAAYIWSVSPGVFLCSWASSAPAIQLPPSSPPFASY